MKVRTRLLILGLISASLLSLTALRPVAAETVLTSEQRQRIVANCQSIKTTLNQLHASDALLRVNRGQIYEAMSSRLMDNFNARLSNNGQDIKGLLVVTNGYKTALTNFRNDYQSYERQLSSLIRTDCSSDPSGFHSALEEARSKRKQVHSDVIKLRQYISDYRSAANDFLINYERLAGDQ